MDYKETIIKLKPCAKTKTMYPANQVAEAQVIIDQKQVETQAEISFKAGIKEVVEFIRAHSQLERCDPDVMAYFIDYLAIDYPDWQNQLSEWGLND